MPTAYEKLSTLLKELFQLDQADLDFGIYRIMNQKRDEITRFLDEELLPQVRQSFVQYHPVDKKVLEEKLQQASQAAVAAGFDPEQSPKVKEVHEQLATYSVDTGALENEVYSHLYSFFRRYYDNGDFISMRRYKEGVYAIPYEGEEVKLHWANADQYYVKTTENFRDYAFRLPSGRLAHFKIVEAETEKDNIKAANEKEHRFTLTENFSHEETRREGQELILHFEYRADPEKRDQKTLNTQAAETILAGAPADWAADLKIPAPTESNPRRTLLEKHLADYTARNTFDYFIHKDLRGFLRRELDFYIKNEVMRLDDIEDEAVPRVEQYLSKIKVLRSIAHKIIAFLAQIEDFQKKLWLKKKFVVETNYCFTLDRVPEELYPEICVNDAQREEWVRLFAIDEIKGDLLKPGYNEPLTVEFLKANLFLVLDTNFFEQTFVDQLLSRIEDIDGQMDGLLIQSENFQTLCLLKTRYKEQIKCIYIDPPYNTSASEILYKNNYKHSSWISLINDRLVLGINLLCQSGFNITTIDYAELFNLGMISDQVFGNDSQVGIVTVFINPKGRQHERFFSSSTEYMLVYSKNLSIAHFKQTTIDIAKTNQFELSDQNGQYRLDPFARIRTSTRRSAKSNFWYPIYVSPNLDEITLVKKDGYFEVFPVNEQGEEFSWKVIPESFEENNRQSFYVALRDERGKVQIYNKFYEQQVYPNIWTDKKYFPEFQGTNLLKNILGEDQALFSYPKSVFAVSDAIKIASDNNDLILDYFAGSGTTAHAVINLNREDGGHRKYILVEMGEYFGTVLKPRIEKVIYSKDWKDGKPVSREGSSHCFKYMRLESA